MVRNPKKEAANRQTDDQGQVEDEKMVDTDDALPGPSEQATIMQLMMNQLTEKMAESMTRMLEKMQKKLEARIEEKFTDEILITSREASRQEHARKVVDANTPDSL